MQLLLDEPSVVHDQVGGAGSALRFVSSRTDGVLSNRSGVIGQPLFIQARSRNRIWIDVLFLSRAFAHVVVG